MLNRKHISSRKAWRRFALNPLNQMAENRQKTGFRGPTPEVGRASRWQPGCPSPNPGGRPKKTPLTDLLRKACDNPKEAKEIIGGILSAAKRKSAKSASATVSAFREIADRVDGPVVSRSENLIAGVIQLTVTEAQSAEETLRLLIAAEEDSLAAGGCEEDLWNQRKKSRFKSGANPTG